MSRRFLFGVDDSENTLQALKSFAELFLESDVILHLFHAVPEFTPCLKVPSYIPENFLL